MGLNSLGQETLCTVEDVLVLNICTFYIFLILEWLALPIIFSGSDCYENVGLFMCTGEKVLLG